ncbi:MAG: hypothetical protein KC777_23865 [Cyanobacteria bacterium HKST-UBA02]|nr:hypothetical protein [Cyanobacteria bacterium HKST-UBA02]
MTAGKKNGDLYLIGFCVVSLFLMLGQIFLNSNISVVAESPVVTTESFNAATPPISVSKDEHAATNWDFGVKTELKYSLNSQETLGGDYAVNIRIDSARIYLNLPITVYLPESPSPALAAHEQGHVTICKRVYQGAPRVAMMAARKVVGHSFSGSGSSEAAAYESALLQAENTLIQYFKDHTADVAEGLSRLFDKLHPDGSETTAASIEEVFRTFRETRKSVEIP